MADRDHDTTVIHTGESGNSGASWFIVGALVVIGVIVGYFYLADGTPGDSVNVTVENPAAEAPAPAESPAPSGTDAPAQ